MIKDFKRILFPVDFSEVSPEIVPWVLLTAKKFEAEIHLLFVSRSFEHLASVYVPVVSIEHFQSEVIEGAETKIEEFANTHFGGYPVCKTKVTVGDAAEEILEYIEKEKIDLVVMGTHGRKGLERVLFGSVAERVIKMSSRPVLSINPYKLSNA
jgi:nucleotide-binding universal stress UspA family protein